MAAYGAVTRKLTFIAATLYWKASLSHCTLDQQLRGTPLDWLLELKNEADTPRTSVMADSIAILTFAATFCHASLGSTQGCLAHADA